MANRLNRRWRAGVGEGIAGGRTSILRPGSLRAAEGEDAAGAGLVEVVDLGLAELATEAVLMLANGVRDGIGEVAGDVGTTLGKRDADGIEAAGVASETAAGSGATDRDLGCAGKVWRGDPGVEAEGDRIVRVIRIGEDLIKVADTEEGLIGEARREDVVVDDCVVFYVNRGDLEVGLNSPLVGAVWLPSPK
jgi:hypothetical protein